MHLCRDLIELLIPLVYKNAVDACKAKDLVAIEWMWLNRVHLAPYSYEHECVLDFVIVNGLVDWLPKLKDFILHYIEEAKLRTSCKMDTINNERCFIALALGCDYPQTLEWFHLNLDTKYTQDDLNAALGCGCFLNATYLEGTHHLKCTRGAVLCALENENLEALDWLKINRKHVFKHFRLKIVQKYYDYLMARIWFLNEWNQQIYQSVVVPFRDTIHWVNEHVYSQFAHDLLGIAIRSNHTMMTLVLMNA